MIKFETHVRERPTFDHWQLMKARVVAVRSHDPSTQCGCVIVRPDKSICSEGYNGFPRRMEDKLEWYHNRDEKYDRIIHAEMNALLAAKEPVVGYTAYCTTPSCKECAKHLCAAGIARVVWSIGSHAAFKERWVHNLERALEIYTDCKVEVSVL